MALWDGRFSGGPSEEMVRFSECIGIDMRMWREDIQGSVAHAKMLAAVGLITTAESEQLVQGLQQVAGELESGAFVPSAEHEDIHMAVESRLTEIVGSVGAKLHTARSRNDQVATDVRLWMRATLGALCTAQQELLQALLDRVDVDGDVLIPGFTHLQRGQPIFLGHHLLAHAWMVKRDAERILDCMKRLDACPLGAGAMAGTPHPIDRHLSAELLGFKHPISNAMDAVAARDHLIEAVGCCAIAMSHLSRQAEELVLWSTAEFRLIRMGEPHTTGSSIMPQKRNPDAAELVRGKMGRVVGSLNALLTMVKGLPLAYNRDLQEDREALFDAVETATACTRITASMWRELSVVRDRYDAALQGDFLLATEIADYLVTKGVPFREAHHVSGCVVSTCEQEGIGLHQLESARWTTFHPDLDEGVETWLEPNVAADRRNSYGGTALTEIRRQLDELRQWQLDLDTTSG